MAHANDSPSPPPWHYDGCDVFDADSCLVAACDAGDGAPSRQRANARLIAAAPDGHELLLAIHEYFRHWNPVQPTATIDDQGTTFKAAVEAYVASAKGGAQ